MGYACPVCDTPQADQRHLADHLAITAMTHGDEHETWLDEHVPDWHERGPAELGPVVADHAAEADYPQVFEDTTSDHDHDHGPGRRHDHGHDHDRGQGGRLEDEIAGAGRRGPGGRGDLTADQASVLERAREMTAEMLSETESDTEGDVESDTEGDSETRDVTEDDA